MSSTWAKIDTAKTFLVGPVLDADGAAKTDEVVANIKVTKNGSVGAAHGSSTLTHNHAGMYLYAANAGDFDTLGEVTFSLNSGTNAMPAKSFQVVCNNAYVALVEGEDVLASNLESILGTALAETSAGYLAAAFKKLLDVATPGPTINDLANKGDEMDLVDAPNETAVDVLKANVAEVAAVAETAAVAPTADVAAVAAVAEAAAVADIAPTAAVAEVAAVAEIAETAPTAAVAAVAETAPTAAVADTAPTAAVAAVAETAAVATTAPTAAVAATAEVAAVAPTAAVAAVADPTDPAQIAAAVTVAFATAGLTEADGDDIRFTANALEEAPTGSGSGLTAQETRDAMKLAPSEGDPSAGSVDAKLDGVTAGTPANVRIGGQTILIR